MDFVSAVQALYGSDPVQQANANQWLQAFSSTPGSWQQGASLLRPEYPSEMQFFSSNLLLTKVRRDWPSLNAGERTLFTTAISESLQSLMQSPSTERVVLQRVCAVMTSIAVASGHAAVQTVNNQALTLVSNGISQQNSTSMVCGVCLLGALPEEASCLSHSKRLQLLPQLPLAQVLQALGYVIGANQHGDVGLCCAAVRAVCSWLELPLTECGMDVSLGGTYVQQGPLLDALLACLKHTDENLLDAATDVLLRLISDSRDSEAGEAAVQKLLTQLVSQRERVAATSESCFARCVAQLAAQYAEECPEEAAGSTQQALALCECVLGCMGREERNVVEIAAEYLYNISTVPMSERPGPLQLPLYQRVIQLLGPHVMYPPGFTTWEECVEDDEDSFHRFRDDVLDDTLATCYAVLRMQYLNFWANQLQSARDWRAAESALWSIRRVSDKVLSWCTSKGEEEGGAPSAAMIQDRQDTHAFLWTIFSQLTAGVQGLLSAHQGVCWVTRSAANLIAAYAAWFAGTPQAPLEPALQYCLQAAADPKASVACARAFQSLCQRCATRLSSSVSQLIPALHRVTPGMGPAAVRLLYSGAAAVVAAMPPEEAGPAAAQLIHPVVETAKECINACRAGGASGQALSALQHQVLVIGGVMRALELAGGEGGAAAGCGVLYVWQWCGPVVQSVLETPQLSSNEALMAAVCKVYISVVSASPQSVFMSLQSSVSLLLSAYNAHHHPPCLDVLTILMLHCGESADCCAGLAQLARGVAEATQPIFQQGGVPPESGVVCALFKFAHACSTAGPVLAKQPDVLDSFLSWAMQSLAVRDAEAVRSLILFVQVLVEPSASQASKLDPQSLLDALSRHGASLCAAIMLAAADTCPRGVLRQLGTCLYGMLAHPCCSEAAQRAVHDLVMTDGFAGVPPHQFAQEDKLRFLAVLLRQPPLAARRFGALLLDFAGVCRAEATADTILAYEL